MLGFLLVAVAAGVFMATPAGQVMGERAAYLVRDMGRKVHFFMGWPLPGTPDLARFDERLAMRGLNLGQPVFIRIFKREHELELWMQKDGRFERFETYPICTWSGKLGPKLRRGDYQAPEGFYTVSRAQLNPNSRWHRSFNLGYPNVLDRAHGRTGDYLMVHGGCSSAGCYAMTDAVVEEIWRLVSAALRLGQKRFAVHVFPFRMNDATMRLHQGSEWDTFWSDLRPAQELFDKTRVPPRIRVCDGRYHSAAGVPGHDGSAAILRDCAPQPASPLARVSRQNVALRLAENRCSSENGCWSGN
jgi:murein L,D-transpeptidase YafK